MCISTKKKGQNRTLSSKYSILFQSKTLPMLKKKPPIASIKSMDTLFNIFNDNSFCSGFVFILFYGVFVIGLFYISR